MHDHDHDHRTLPVTHRCIAAFDPGFHEVRLRCPGDPRLGATLVEIPMHDGPRPPKVVHLCGVELLAAVRDGILVVIAPGASSEGPAGPVPAAIRGPRSATRPTRGRSGAAGRGRAVLVDLWRRGLIMTGAEYVRSLEARRH